MTERFKKRLANAATSAQVSIARGTFAEDFQASIKKAVDGPGRPPLGRRPNIVNPLSRRGVKGESKKDSQLFVGVDGEGKGRRPHLYVLLCASDEFGKNRWSVENPAGLTTAECLDFLLELPSAVKTFAFSFNYDLTKMLTDVSDDKLYRLLRPELRQRPTTSKIRSPLPVRWMDPKTDKTYLLNLQGSKFSVGYDYRNRAGKRSRRTRVVWDVFKFYQSKFVEALKLWNVGGKDLEEITRMKDRRSVFDQETALAIRDYCFSECMYLGQLARKLVNAHVDAGLELKSFYGAGSSATAMLDVMGIKEKRKEPPERMKEAVSSAFFGGRFEHSVIGPIPGPVYSFDISSAYPYQCCFLPCLEHGVWSKTKSRADMLKARGALVHYGLGAAPEKQPWAPFPYRDSDGNITFPDRSGGGHIWRDEFLAGEKLFPYVKFRSAWILNSDCKCQPFRMISRYYMNRLRLGKEGAGIAIKLGCNSCFVAGTLVKTERGEVPIESVTTHDRVSTRVGWRRVLDAGLTRRAMPTMALQLSNGRELQGTPDHKIWTTNRDWVRLDELREDDSLLGLDPGATVIRMQRRDTCAKADVYCLTVDTHHEFFANGILVANCYGKLAQSVGGTPPFQSWIWAGMITSGCRSQILELMGLHKDLSNLLSIATDGIYTVEDIPTPAPKDTGTANALNEKGELANKPLGGWERKVVHKGVFFARPGIYFPLEPTREELKTVRARGIGRAAMYEAWREMVEAFAQGRENIHIENDELQRFCGAKSQISISGLGTANVKYRRSPAYGEWLPRPTDLSLNPMPKREEKIHRPPGEAYGILSVRSMDPKVGSAPYSRAVGALTPDALLLKLAELEAEEQPDGGDLSEDFFDD